MVQTSQVGQLEICLILNAFKIVPLEQLSCTAVGESNVLQIFLKERESPKKWATYGYHLDMYKYLHISGLNTLIQNSNPMSRGGNTFSTHLYHIQAVFSKHNISLTEYDGAYMYSDPTPSVLFGVSITRGNQLRDDDEVFILTGFHGFSFLTCYSKDSITFEFYLTPFEPEIWYGLLAAYLCLTLCLMHSCPRHKAPFLFGYFIGSTTRRWDSCAW